MMNKSEIDWCDFTWNPVTGCGRGCAYCYARKQALRFAGDVRVNITDPQLHAVDGPKGKIYTLPQPFKNGRGKTIPHPAGFVPTFHEYRLGDIARKKKPASIFVCSMADLFGPFIPDEWIEKVFEACKAAPWHHYMFLTKYPERYADLENAGKLPTASECPNFWYGTTITNPTDPYFHHIGNRVNTFLSIEPIRGSLEFGILNGVHWIIVGAETGNQKGKVTPRRSWIAGVVEAAYNAHIPVLLKDSAEPCAVWGDDLIQDFPPELRPMPEDNSIPHCKGCDQAEVEAQGKRGEKITCKATGQHARGRYTRSSPPWCPKRRKNKTE